MAFTYLKTRSKKYTEDDLQRAVAKYLLLQYPQHTDMWCHTPNGMKTSRSQANKHKSFGMRAGVPDILIFVPSKQFNGLAVELKIQYASGKKNQTSAAQKKWLKNLSLCGWRVKVCYNFDDAKNLIDSYLG